MTSLEIAHWKMHVHEIVCVDASMQYQGFNVQGVLLFVFSTG